MKNRKQIIKRLETLTNAELLAEYRSLVAAKRWDEARLAKQEMSEAWRLIKSHLCDCENPEPKTGVAGVSEACPIHGRG